MFKKMSAEMKWFMMLVCLVALLGVLFLAMAPNTIAAPPGGAGQTANLNARFIRWQQLDHVIHSFVFNDDGRTGVGAPPAVVEEGQPVLFGFEWTADPGQTVADLQAQFVDNPNHDIRLSIDGGSEMSVKGGYQDAFFAGTRNGPAWTWDHDGDGPSDGDGDGIDDWNGPVVFFRHLHGGALAPGTHTFTFIVYEQGMSTVSDTITVEVVTD